MSKAKTRLYASTSKAAVYLVETEELPHVDRFQWEEIDMPDMTGKVVVVTGGNSGLGYASCLALAKKGAKVYLTARDTVKGVSAASKINEYLGTENVHCMHLDLAQFDSVKKFAKEFLDKGEPLHLLLNNAGIHLPGGLSESPESSGQRTPEGFEVTLGTNYFGPFLLTELLLPKLKESAPSRVVNVGSPGEQFSGGVHWEDLKGENKTESDMNVYGSSKLYNIMAAKALNERLKGSNVEAFAAHPGITKAPLYSKTDKSKPMGLNVSIAQAIGGQDTERGAGPILYAATNLGLSGKGGAFIGGPTGPALPFSNLDQYKDRPTFTGEGKDLSECLRLYDETLKILQPHLESIGAT